MFNDMVFEKLTGKNKAILDPLLKVMAGRPLKVATMCSGTESPVLALDMLSNAIEEFYLKHRRDEIDLPGGAEGQPVFQVEHVFSCEVSFVNLRAIIAARVADFLRAIMLCDNAKPFIDLHICPSRV